MSASVNLSLHHKVQKFSSGTGSPGWSRKNGRKMVVVLCGDASFCRCLQPFNLFKLCLKAYVYSVLTCTVFLPPSDHSCLSFRPLCFATVSVIILCMQKNNNNNEKNIISFHVSHYQNKFLSTSKVVETVHQNLQIHPLWSSQM